jgi:hypothetical protein
MKVQKILILTDSRGVHKPAGSTHKIYAERLANTSGIKLTSYRCPYKWTTIPDLIGILDELGADNFDMVILHAGIVDHSPRGISNMLKNLIDPISVTSFEEEKVLLNSRNFSKQKVTNRKRVVLENIFGASKLAAYYSKPFDQSYEGEKTINLYSLDMLKTALVPRLKTIKNLLFISSNNFSRGWSGDFTKKRPENIYMIEDYSRVLCDELANVINLHQWSDSQVRRFTCDNLHLTKEGSDWIYLRILESLGLRKRDYFENRKSIWPSSKPTHWPLSCKSKQVDLSSILLAQQKQLSKADIVRTKQELGLKNNEALACLVVGFKFGEDGDNTRKENMRYLLEYIVKTYPGAFDILLVEQDSVSKFEADGVFSNCRYEFIYNPNAYNRGWLYNVATKHYISNKVVAFLDTDIIPGENFLDCIIDCHKDFDFISPNRSLYYSSEQQTQEFRNTGKFDDFPVTDEFIKNPTTLSGGMLVVKRDVFLDIGGFEQYVGYGCEDRALDVTVFALLNKERVRMDSYAYFHQYHPIVESERAYFRDIYNHMAENYGCEYSPGLLTTDYIHKNCTHSKTAQIAHQRDLRISHIADPNMYSVNSQLTVNGLPGSLNLGVKLIGVEKDEQVFPPECDGKKPYNDSEELTGKFANAWAPAIKKEIAVDDTKQLQFFYNRFKGKRCFIIGNGPSLNKHDLSLLNNEYSFAVNSFYYKTKETGFKPTFFVVEDSSVIKENKEEILAYDAPFKFFPAIYQSLHPKQPGTYFFNLNRGFYDKFSPNYAIPRFSTDISKVGYCGQSVTYLNLQLAYYMGFTEVYLLGMDFDYIIPESHSRNGDVLTSDTDDPNHFHKDYFGKGKTWKDPKLNRVLMNYQMAKLVYECGGRRIYNATKGGRLEEYERVDYDGLFGGIDRRFKREPLDLTRPDDSLSVLKYPQQNVAENVPAAPKSVVKEKPLIDVKPTVGKKKYDVQNEDITSLRYLLMSLSSAMLLEPDNVMKRLATGGDLSAKVENAIASLPESDDRRQLFLRIKARITNSPK